MPLLVAPPGSAGLSENNPSCARVKARAVSKGVMCPRPPPARTVSPRRSTPAAPCISCSAKQTAGSRGRGATCIGSCAVPVLDRPEQHLCILLGHHVGRDELMKPLHFGPLCVQRIPQALVAIADDASSAFGLPVVAIFLTVDAHVQVPDHGDDGGVGDADSPLEQVGVGGCVHGGGSIPLRWWVVMGLWRVWRSWPSPPQAP